VDLIGSELDPVASSCERDNEPLGSMKGWEFLHLLIHCYIPKKDDFAPWTWLI
jgi:hypothetical protein